MVQIERDTKLAGVDVVEVAAPVDAIRRAACRYALIDVAADKVFRERPGIAEEIERAGVAPFDADHFGAERSEDSRAARAGEQPGQIDYSDAFEGPAFRRCLRIGHFLLPDEIASDRTFIAYLVVRDQMRAAAKRVRSAPSAQTA